MSQLATKFIQNTAVTNAKLNADVAGAGIVGGAGSALAVNVDDSSIEIATDVVQVKALGIATGMLAATSVTAAKLGNDVVGNGLSGGNGSAIVALADTDGGANLAEAINVSSNGIAIKIDDDTIGENGSSQLYVKANSIGASEIDETDSYTWSSGSHDFTSSSSVSIPTPTQDSHAATKGYIDAAVEGRTPKGVANALAASDETLSGIPTNIDGVTTWADNDLVLLINQSAPIENGIWQVHSGAWDRPDNFAAGSSGAGASIWIDAGTTYDDQRWVCITDQGSDVVDTDSLAFQFDGGMTAVSAGTGLQKTGNTVNIGDGSTGNINGIARTSDDISAAVDDSSIEISANVLQIKALGVATGMIAATSVTAAKLGSDVAGDGVAGGNGSALDVDPDTTGGTNLASAVNVSSNGVAIKVDESTIDENGLNRLEVVDTGITNAKLNSDVSGNGIAGGAGSALALDINGIAAAEASADNADLIAIYDDTAGDIRKMTRANFLSGVGSGETSLAEAHTIDSGEVTAGYFTLGQNFAIAAAVQVIPENGIPQHNKQAVGATGISPDFDCLSTNQIHFNDNGAATGLSAILAEGDKVIINYSF